MPSHPASLPAVLAMLLAAGWIGCRSAPPAAAMPTAQPAQVEARPASTPTARSTAAATAAPTLTPTPLHPLTIEALRQQEYPGSELEIAETLPASPGYNSYIVSYGSEGNTLYALLTIPRAERPATGWPVIIFNHGYIDPVLYDTGGEYQDHVETLTLHGYMVLAPDYRGHGRSEGEPASPYSSPAYTIDVLNALASIQRRPDADPERIGLWGHSMGGQITLRAMVISEDIKAGVIWAGVVASYPDLVHHWWRRTGEPTPDPVTGAGGWQVGLLDEVGMPEDNPEFWAAISPNSYLADLSGPIQLHHALDDEIVPVELSRLLAAEMEALGLPVELNLWADDNHNLENNFEYAMLYSVMFFDEFVKGR